MGTCRNRMTGFEFQTTMIKKKSGISSEAVLQWQQALQSKKYTHEYTTNRTKRMAYTPYK